MAAVTNRVIPKQTEQVQADLKRVRRRVEDGDKLVRGDSGPAVKALQRSLRRAGVYSGKITGDFDRDTKKAVISFQRSRGLQVTGKVGKGMARALRDNTLFQDDMFEKPARRGQAGSDVMQAERRLAALGYRTGKVDGVYTKKTAEAVKAFRADNPELADNNGKLNHKVWENLQQAFQSGVVQGGRSSNLRPGDEGKAVRQAERKLDKLGFEVGKVDGKYNAATAAAVAQFQRRNDIKVTGRINERTAKVLDKEAERAQGPKPHKTRRDWFISQFRGKYNTNEDTYSNNGNCGPTSVTMIASAFGKVDIKGHKADAAIERSRRRFGQSQSEQAGTTISGARKALSSYGLNTKLHKGKPSQDMLKRMKSELDKGKLITTVVVPKYFSESLTNGHFTVVTAIKNGKVYLNDPGTNRGPMVISKREFLRCLKLRHAKDSSTFGWVTAKG